MKTALKDRPSRGGATRERVLDEAAKALNRRGVSKTSLAEIAANVGVSRAALYYYFADQEDLVFQSYRRSFEKMARRLSEARAAASHSLDVIDGFIEGMLGPDEPEIAALGEVAFLRPEQRSTIFGLCEGLRASLRYILEDGARRGELRKCHAGLVAPAIIGVISGAFLIRHWRTAASLTPRDIIKAIQAILHHGVAADRNAPARYVAFPLTPPGLPVGSVFDPEVMAAARQEALLTAASWLFSLKGVDATSLEEIALRVGVTKKVIYHNMGDKQALVVQCHRRAYRFYEGVVAGMRDYRGDRIDAMCACVEALAEAGLREDIAPLPLITGYESLPKAAREVLQTAAMRLLNAHLDTYAQGRADGSIREINARAVVSMLPGLVNWIPKWFDALTADERAAAPRELTELYRLGLCPL